MMRPALSDTVFAVAAGGRHAALTVMRLSGPRCAGILAAIGAGGLAPRAASLRSLRDGSRRLLDRALVLWFPAPRSYTGEDCAELHLHGGGAVLDGVVQALSEFGARPAEAGEFTRRAFVNGRIDLLEAEAVGDLVAAETDAQRDQALSQMRGAVGGIYLGWQRRLAQAMATLEAEIDFPDEFADGDRVDPVTAELRDLAREFRQRLDQDTVAEKLRTGLSFAVIGAPNVGKSTLVNAMCDRDVSIVSSIPGTTRDVIEARTTLGGVPVTFVDTAGLRHSGEEIEIEGMRRARLRAGSADLVLLVTDTPDPPPAPPFATEAPTLQIRNKVDLAPGAAGCLNVSAVRGDGMDALRAALTTEALRHARSRTVPALTRPRHRAALADAMGHLCAAVECDGAEFVAEEVRLAMNCLARVSHGVETDEVLDLVFSQFCIGK